MMFNVSLCTIALIIGAYTFTKHLKAFGKSATPAADAWLVSVGMLGWTMLLHASTHKMLTDDVEQFALVLFFIYWVGAILQVQKHCIKLRRKRRSHP